MLLIVLIRHISEYNSCLSIMDFETIIALCDIKPFEGIERLEAENVE